MEKEKEVSGGLQRDEGGRGGTVREHQRGTEREDMNRKKGRDSGIQNEKTQ